MATIAENLQIIKDSVEDIKQAIIDKGGTINGDITTYADAIRGVNNSKSFISFIVRYTGAYIIHGAYCAEEGMTWEEWVNSEYNKEGYTVNININEVWLDNSKLEGVLPSDVIIDQESYYLAADGAD